MPYPEVLLHYGVFRRSELPHTAWRLHRRGIADICVGEPGFEASFIHMEIQEPYVATSIYTAVEFFASFKDAVARAVERDAELDASEPAVFRFKVPNRYEYERIAEDLYGRLEPMPGLPASIRLEQMQFALDDGIKALLNSPWLPEDHTYRLRSHRPSIDDGPSVMDTVFEVGREQRERRDKHARTQRANRERAARGLARNQEWVRQRREAEGRTGSGGVRQPPQTSPVSDADVNRALEAGRALINRRRLGHPARPEPFDPGRMWNCPSCRGRNSNDDDHCVHCGAPGLGQVELGHSGPLRHDSGPAPHSSLAPRSELRACGYQITGMTRKERWRILTGIAIPRLGRKVVVETIKLHIRLREAQNADYSYAIGEWEHDLARIRSLR